MARKVKVAETDPAPPDPDDEGPDDDTDAPGGDGGDAGGDDLESHIRKVVTEVVGSVLGGRNEGGRTTAGQDESSIRQMVKDAQAQLRAEEEKDARFKSVSETVETLKKAVERPPARSGLGGKLQRVMWGSDD